MILLEQSQTSAKPVSNSFRREAIFVGLFLFVFTVFNFVTSTRFPLPWQDETQFTDVAENLASGYGFTSSVWTCGDHKLGSFFACNAPLYPYLNGIWIKAFGFNVLGARSLNYLLIAVACWLIWLAVRRLNLIERVVPRLMLIPLIVCGYGLSINYRSARYDCLCILICSAIFLAFSIRSRNWRFASIALGGAFLPFAGLQLLPFAVVFCLLLLVLARRPLLTEVIALGIGIAVGSLALLGFYQYHGVFQNFMAALHSENPPSFRQRFADSEGRRDRLPRDPSLFLLYGGLLVLAAQQLLRRRFLFRSVVGFGVVAGLLVPLAMLLMGKFTTYYTWMAYIPVSIAILAWVSSNGIHLGQLSTKLAAVAICVSCLLGLPLVAASALYYWPDRNSRPVEEMAAREVGPQDWVYTDYAAYFAVKRRTQYVFIPFIIPSQYRDRISVMILAPGDYEKFAHAIIGGDWYDTGDNLATHGHDLTRHGLVLLQRRNDFKVYKRLNKTMGKLQDPSGIEQPRLGPLSTPLMNRRAAF